MKLVSYYTIHINISIIIIITLKEYCKVDQNSITVSTNQKFKTYEFNSIDHGLDLEGFFRNSVRNIFTFSVSRIHS